MFRLYNDARRAGLLIEIAPRRVRDVIRAAHGTTRSQILTVSMTADALRSLSAIIQQTALAWRARDVGARQRTWRQITRTCVYSRNAFTTTSAQIQ